MKTYVSDNFPLHELECQYMDICNDYDPAKCSYTSPCDLRIWLREVILDRIPRKNLELQIKLIIDENGKFRKRRK